MTYSLDWLISRYQNDERLKYIFFWGHQPRKDAQIGESCFSQWWEAAFEVDGIIYKTAEHWMMARKAELFRNEELVAEITACSSPAEAKKLGREVENFDEQRWSAVKFDLVKQGSFHKFSQNPSLRDYLIHTGERILVEASPTDTIWGIGLKKDTEYIENPSTWRGQNLLGFALMEVRDELRF